MFNSILLKGFAGMIARAIKEFAIDALDLRTDIFEFD